MSHLEDLLSCVLLLIALVFAGWFGVHHYGAARYDGGYAAAVDAGKAQHERDVAAARKTETDLRAQLRDHDEDAHVKEQAYEVSLEVAQRRVRTGVDRLRCPAASAVQPTTAASDRPPTGGPGVDGEGPELVPESAADILGDGAAIAGLVRRYGRVVARFEACRALNAK